MTPDVGHEEAAGVAAQRQPRWDAAFLRVAQFENLRFGKVTVLEFECVNDFVAGPAAIEFPSIVGEFHAVERFIDGKLAHDRGRRHVHHGDLMAAMAAVQNSGEPTGGMHGDVDRKIAEHNLSAHRPQRPLVGQKDRAVGALSGQIGGWLAGRWRGNVGHVGDTTGERNTSRGRHQFEKTHHKE